MKKENTRVEIFNNLRKVEIIVGRKIQSILSGTHLSVLKGRGSELDDFKQYQQGDDPRDIAWRLTFKLPNSDIMVKKYRQEKKAKIGIFLDFGSSMVFGSNRFSKRDFGVLIAGALGCSALAFGDRVDLFGFGTKIEKSRSLISGKGALVERLLDMREAFIEQPKKQELDFSVIFKEIAGYRGHLVFVISDFITEFNKDFIKGLELGLVRREIVPVLVSDPREKILPSFGIHTLRDPETNEAIVINCSDKKQRKEVERILEERIKEFGKIMNKLGILWTEVQEDKKWIEELIKLFLQKKFLSRRF